MKLPIKTQMILEIIGGFLLIELLNRLFFLTDLGFMTVPIHPYWVIILLAASRHGVWVGSSAGFLAAILFTYHGLPAEATQNKIEYWIDNRLFILPLAFYLTGYFIGSIRERFKKEEALLRSERDQYEQENTALTEESHALKSQKKDLEKRLDGELAITQNLYEACFQLRGAHLKPLCQEALALFQKYFQVTKASVYLYQDEYFELIASVGHSPDEFRSDRVNIENTYMRFSKQKNVRLTIQELISHADIPFFERDYDKVVAMIPLQNAAGNYMGLIHIDKMEFLSMTNRNFLMMDIVASWIGNMLEVVLIRKKMEALEKKSLETGLFFYKQLEVDFQFAKGLEHVRGMSLFLVSFAFDRTAELNEEIERLYHIGFAKILQRYQSEYKKFYHDATDSGYLGLGYFDGKADLQDHIEKMEKDFQTMINTFSVQQENIAPISLETKSLELKHPYQDLEQSIKELVK